MFIPLTSTFRVKSPVPLKLTSALPRPLYIVTRSVERLIFGLSVIESLASVSHRLRLIVPSSFRSSMRTRTGMPGR